MRPGQAYREFKTRDGRRLLLRALRRSDLPSLLKFANSLVREKRANRELGLTGFDRWMKLADERRYLDGVLRGLAAAKVISVGAVAGGEVVGHCDIGRRRSPDERHAGVLGIAILKEYRGVGLGRAMVETAMGEAARAGIWLVELQAFASNRAAVRLYSELGFRKVGFVPDKFLRDGRAIGEVKMCADLRFPRPP